MRRSLGGLLVGILAALLYVQGPGAYAGTEPRLTPAAAGGGHAALAVWTVREDARTVLYLVEAVQSASTTRVGGFARVSRSVCRPRLGQDCRITGPWHEVTPLEFTVDPLVRSAHLKVDWEGEQHSLEWAALKESRSSYTVTQIRADAGGVQAYRYKLVEARATGRVFGADVKNLGRGYAALMQGVSAAADLDDMRSWILSHAYRKATK